MYQYQPETNSYLKTMVYGRLVPVSTRNKQFSKTMAVWETCTSINQKQTVLIKPWLCGIHKPVSTRNKQFS
jgi:hypothetical protein